MTASQLEATRKDLQEAVAPRLMANVFRTLSSAADQLAGLAEKLGAEKRLSLEELRELERELAALLKILELEFPPELFEREQNGSEVLRQWSELGGLVSITKLVLQNTIGQLAQLQLRGERANQVVCRTASGLLFSLCRKWRRKVDIVTGAEPEPSVSEESEEPLEPEQVYCKPEFAQRLLSHFRKARLAALREQGHCP